jgi:hypothetical protein
VADEEPKKAGEDGGGGGGRCVNGFLRREPCEHALFLSKLYFKQTEYNATTTIA